MIPYSRQSIDDDDIDAVADVLRGDWLTTGPYVEEFEDALAEYVGAAHAVAVNSGTAALHLALLASGIGTGDHVATTTISFSASANCARYVGADLTLVDIDPQTYNIAVADIPVCDALVAVDFTGLPVDLTDLRERAPIVIEDAAQSLGARRPSGPIGNCSDVDMTTFSFHPVKSITTGEGGAITTNDSRLAERLRRLRSHGMSATPEKGAWTYDIEMLGHNFRLPDINAALGRSQLRRLDEFIRERNRLSTRYRELLADLPEVILPPEAPEGVVHAYHLFVIKVAERRRIYEELRAQGIGVQVHHVPIHRLGIYRDLGWKPAAFPNAESYYAHALSLPLFPGLSIEDQDRVAAALRHCLRS